MILYQPDRRNKKGRSRSPVKKPDVLKVVLASKKVDSAGGSKPVSAALYLPLVKTKLCFVIHF